MRPSDGPTLTSSRIISERFSGFAHWPYGSRRLCVACAWAYSRRLTTQSALLITTTTVTEYPHAAGLADTLTRGPLPNTQAVVVPTANHRRRRHILPTAQWGHLATDGLVVRWDHAAAARLTDLAWLRTTVGARMATVKPGRAVGAAGNRPAGGSLGADPGCVVTAAVVAVCAAVVGGGTRTHQHFGVGAAAVIRGARTRKRTAA
jgi:hypothetical protein